MAIEGVTPDAEITSMLSSLTDDDIDKMSEEQAVQLMQKLQALQSPPIAIKDNRVDLAPTDRTDLPAPFDVQGNPVSSPNYGQVEYGPEAVTQAVKEKFNEELLTPALKLGAGALGGYAGAGLMGLAGAALPEGLVTGTGLLGRLAAPVIESFGANAGAQVPISMMDDSNYLHELNPATHPVQSAISYGLPFLAAGGRELGRYSNSANREEAMRGVFSQNPQDYVPGPGRMGVPAAVNEVKPIINDPSIITEAAPGVDSFTGRASSPKPLSELSQRVSTAKDLAGQKVGALVDQMDNSGRVVPTAMLDPDAILSSQAGGSSARGAEAVAKVEYEAMAKRAFVSRAGTQNGTAMYEDFSNTRKLSDMRTNPDLFEVHPGAEVVYAENPTAFFEYKAAAQRGATLSKKIASGYGQAADMDELANLNQTMREFDGDIKARLDSRLMQMTREVADSPNGAGLVHRLRQDFDAKAGYPENKGTIREEQYRAMADTLRGYLQSFADSIGIGPQFAAANRRYSALAELAPQIEQTSAIGLRASPAVDSSVMSVRLQGRPPFVTPQITGRQVGSAAGHEGLLRTALGQTKSQRLGGFLEGVDVNPVPLAALGKTDVDPSTWFSPSGALDGMKFPAQNLPPVQNSPTPQSLATRVRPPTIPSDGPFLLPRTLTELNPQMVEFSIGNFVPPEMAQPLTFEWKRLLASQDLEGMANFLGTLKTIAPDIPMAPGPITGLPSEFDLGDGRARLFSPMDVIKWRDQIEKSPLREDEKAQRVNALHRDGTVYPNDLRVNDFQDSTIASGYVKDIRSATMENFEFAGRSSTPSGSRKLQEIER